VFSISEHSAGISWLQPAQPAAVGAELVAPEAAAPPDGRSAPLLVAAAVAVAAAGLAEGVEAPVALPAQPDAAVVAVVQPEAAAQLAEFEASARPAEWARLELKWVWAAAVELRLAFAPFPERSALLQGLEPIRRLSAEGVLAHSFPAFSEQRRLPED
jgi:hypothetical protein